MEWEIRHINQAFWYLWLISFSVDRLQNLWLWCLYIYISNGAHQSVTAWLLPHSLKVRFVSIKVIWYINLFGVKEKIDYALPDDSTRHKTGNEEILRRLNQQNSTWRGEGATAECLTPARPCCSSKPCEII